MDRALLVKNAVSTVCQERGHAGCCDNSPGRHATAHLRLAGYPVIRSYEPGEDWHWCYLVGVDIPQGCRAGPRARR